MKFKSDVELQVGLADKDGDLGTSGQILSSTGTQTNWITPNPGDITGVIAGNKLTGGGTSGTVTLGLASNNVSQWTNDSGYTTSVGDITSVSAGVGLSGGGTSGAVTLTLDLGGLSVGGTLLAGDYLIAENGGNDRRQLVSSIPLSVFNNNSGWTSNTGTTTASNTQTFTNKSGNISQWTNDSGYITSSSLPTVSNAMVTVSTAAGLDGGTTFTLNQSANKTISLTLDLDELAVGGTLLATDHIVAVNGTASQKQLISSIPLSIFNNNAGWTSNVGDITGVTAGSGISGGGTSGTVTVTNSDKGSSQSIFKNVAVSGQSTVIADSNNDTLTLVAAGGMTITTDAATDTITFNPNDDNSNYYVSAASYSAGTLTLTRNGLSTLTATGFATNNNQLSNGAGYTTNTGTTTASNTQTFTNKSGNISQWTNDSGYVTSSGGSMSSWILKEGNGVESTSVTNGETVTFAQGDGITSEMTSTTSGGTITITNTKPNIVQTTITGNAGSATVLQTARTIAGVSFNGSANISLNNNAITNGAGYTTNTGTTTASNTQTFTNKSGNISQWTNDAGYITSAGDITGVIAGTGLSGGGTSGTVTLTLDLGELAVGGTLIATDYLIAENGGVDNRQLISSIPLSIFNNNSGWTSNAGDITAVVAGTGMSGGGTSGSVTLNCTITNNNQLTNGSGYTTYAEPGIFSGGGTPTLATGVTAAEVRTLIGAGTSSSTGTVTSIATSTGLSGGTITTSGTLTNTDRGSQQNIFKNIAVSGQSTVVADSNNDTITLVAAGGMTITTNATTDTITFNPNDDNSNYYTTAAAFNTGNGIISFSGAGGQPAYSVDIDGRYVTTSGVTSVATSGTVSGLTLTGGTITSTGTITLGGTLALTSANVTTGLGFTPYNATNPSGYTTNTGTTTASNTQTFTNKSGNISQWTNDAGYITSAGDITGVTAGTGLSGGGTSGTVTLTLDLGELAVGGTLIATDYIIAENGGVDNRQLISAIPLSIFSNNSGWTSNTGTTTASNTQTFTNKSGNISQWTNNSGYITSASLPIVNNATITFTAGTGLTGGGIITLNQSGNETVTFNNSITNNNQLSNGAGYVTSSGVTSVSGVAATNITTSILGTAAVPIVSAALNATGTASSSTYLRGDNTWATISAGGSGTVTSVTAGTGLSQTGTSTVNPTILIDYLGTDNFIANQTQNETGISLNDHILVSAFTSGNVQKVRWKSMPLPIQTGDGTTWDAGAVAVDVDSTVVRTTGTQSIGGAKTFTSNVTGFGSVTFTAANFILSSDERLKENIKGLEPNKINTDWKSFNMKDSEGYRVGVIAQELEVNHPEFVETNDEGFKSVKYIDLLISKIAELEDRIKQLEN